MGIKELLKLIAGSLGATSEELSSVKTVKDCLRLIANHVTSGSGGFDLSDRMAKGVDDQGNIVKGAVIEGNVTGDYRNEATVMYSHAEGSMTHATGSTSHAEGMSTFAVGMGSHAEGNGSRVEGQFSHAEGGGTLVKGHCSHAEGLFTRANRAYQHVFGMSNITDTAGNTYSDKGEYVEIVGNGDSEGSVRSNARTLDWNGNEAIAGSLTLGLGTENAVTISPQQLAQLLNLLNT